MVVEVRYSTEFGSTATTMDIEKLPSFTTRFKILSVKPFGECYTKKDMKRAFEDVISQLSLFLLSSFLNKKHLFLEEEMNYLMEVRDYIAEKVSELRNKQNLDFLEKKGKLTPEQVDDPNVGQYVLGCAVS